jgi:hypothetical protein
VTSLAMTLGVTLLIGLIASAIAALLSGRLIRPADLRRE